MPKQSSSSKQQAKSPENASLTKQERREYRRLMDQLARFDEYVVYLQNYKRMLLTNFLGGIMRGLGFAIGFSILGAVVVILVQRLALANLPGIGDFFAEVVRIVQMKLY